MAQPLFFPRLRGQGWSVKRRPTTSTRVATHVSGREVRTPLYVSPLYEFEVVYESLTSNAAFAGLGAVEDLQGFILACGGQLTPFVYVDPTANAVTGQLIGTGDGTTKTFALQRAVNRQFVEPVSWVTSVSKVVVYSAGSAIDYGYASDPPSATIDYGSTTSAGTTVDYGTSAPASTAYAFAQTGNASITLTIPPTAGATIFADFAYGFLCRFMDDQFELENTMNNLWQSGSIKFKTFR